MLSAKETGELHNLLGDVEERAGNLVAAAEEYQRAAHMDPTEDHLFDWGNNLVQLRAFEPATEVFSAAVARYPKSARLYVGLGIARYSRGQYEDAVKTFCRAADLAPTDPRAYQFLGEMYGVVPELGGEVTRRLARFVKAQPGNALAHFHYAMSLWKESTLPTRQPADMRQVEALLRRAVALDPKLAKGFLELGILLSDEQRYKEAIQELRTPRGWSPAWRRRTTGWRRPTSAQVRTSWPRRSSRSSRSSRPALADREEEGEACGAMRGRSRIGWFASPSGSSHSSLRSCSLRPLSTNTSARGAIAGC